MRAFYSVIQYVPDPTADERMNIGVLVYGDGRVRSEFVSDWRRVKGFGREDVSFLKEFAREIRLHSGPNLVLPTPDGRPVLNEEVIRRMAGDWLNSIQVSEPVGTLVEPDALLEFVSLRFLHHWAPSPRDFRDRRDARNIATKAIKHALERRTGSRSANRLVQTELPIEGRLATHEFDVGVKNGEIYAAAVSVSFEVRDSEEREQQLKLALFDISDVRAVSADLPMAVVVLPPKQPLPRFEVFRSSVSCAGAEFVPEAEVDMWAERVAERVAATREFDAYVP